MRVTKTHSPARLLPVNEAARYLVVVRDPKEVLVSLYHFAPQAYAFLGLQTGSPDDWVKNQVPGGWWADHTASWWALRDKTNVHIETFNDLKADSSAAIDRLSEFLGVKLSPEQRQHVLEKSSFDYMKAMDHRFSPIIGNTDMPVIVRKGQTGTGSELFTEEQLASIDAFCKRELERLGPIFRTMNYLVELPINPPACGFHRFTLVPTLNIDFTLRFIDRSTQINNP